MLPGPAGALSRGSREAFAVAAGDEIWRTARSRLARHHPQELRLHASHRRPRLRRTGKRPDGKPFYEPNDAQKLLCKHAVELGIEMVPVQAMVYVPEHDEYFSEDQVPEGATVADISGPELQDILNQGEDIPGWFTFPEVARQIRRSTASPRQGLAIFITGLSGAGKSTVANCSCRQAP